ncbi:MAG: FG-GAP-like repeat-containing protein [Planctomycetota bacterium]
MKKANRFDRSVGLAGTMACLGVMASAHAGGLPTPFTEEAISRGLDYTMQSHFGSYGWFGFGAGFADLDADGDDDVIVVGAANGRVGLFENDGAGNFTDRSFGSGISVLTEGSAFAAGDYNGDGLIDLYFTQVGRPNVLVENLGNFLFNDVSVASGTADTGAGKGAVWGDINNDGYLDLYLCNYSTVVPIPGDNEFNKLYLNQGDGTFVNIAVENGMDSGGQGFEAVFTDYDKDGDVDLYLSNDNRPPGPFEPNQLYRNDGGTFTNVSVESGADVQLFSMGLAAGDFDRNGWPDYYTTNTPGGWGIDNPLLLNQGDGTFIEFGVQAGVHNHKTSWGSIFFDYNNDARMDLYVNNMWELNTFFIGDDAFPCLELGFFLGVQSTSNVSFCSSVADVNGDGAIDLLLNDMDIPVQLFMNNEGQDRNWIRFRMLGPYPNRYAIGGNATVIANGISQFREVYAGGNGFLGQNELTLHFGLDDATAAEGVAAQWPGGAVTRNLHNYPANHTWTLYAPEELGDSDGDGRVNAVDFPTFVGCYNAPFLPGCEIMDFNGDAVVDDADYDAFLLNLDEVAEDCNLNGRIDFEEILSGTSIDANANGLIDDCEAAPCVADCAPDNGDGTFGNGVINIDDLLEVINAFGGTSGPCDIAPDNGDGTYGNGTINIDDVLTVINAFGDCP